MLCDYIGPDTVTVFVLTDRLVGLLYLCGFDLNHSSVHLWFWNVLFSCVCIWLYVKRCKTHWPLGWGQRSCGTWTGAEEPRSPSHPAPSEIWRSPATFTKTFRGIWAQAFLNHRVFTQQICPGLPLVDLGLVQEGLWLVHLDQNVWWGDGLADSEDAGIAFWQRTVSKPRWGGGQRAAVPRVIGRCHGLAVKSRTRIDASWNERHLSVTTQISRQTPSHDKPDGGLGGMTIILTFRLVESDLGFVTML